METRRALEGQESHAGRRDAPMTVDNDEFAALQQRLQVAEQEARDARQAAQENAQMLASPEFRQFISFQQNNQQKSLSNAASPSKRAKGRVPQFLGAQSEESSVFENQYHDPNNHAPSFRSMQVDNQGLGNQAEYSEVNPMGEALFEDTYNGNEGEAFSQPPFASNQKDFDATKFRDLNGKYMGTR